MTTVFLAVPLLIDLAAIVSWRGGYRYGAIIPLPFLLLAFAVDVNSVLHGGNLSGLSTLFATVPTLLLLLALAVAQSFGKSAATERQTLSKHLSWMALAVLVIIAGAVVVYAWSPVG